MQLTAAQLQAWLVVGLPVIYSFVSTTLAKLVAQDKWSKEANAVLVYGVVIVCAVLGAFAHGQLVYVPNASLNDAVNMLVNIGMLALTLVLTGPLMALKPYMLMLNAVQANLFNVVALVHANPTVVPSKPVQSQKTQGPTPITLPTRNNAPSNGDGLGG